MYSGDVSHIYCRWKIAMLSQRRTVHNTWCIDCIFYSAAPNSASLFFPLLLLLSFIWSPLSTPLSLSFLSLCTQVSRVPWPCFLFSCWIITWPPGSSASGMALSPWASPSVGRPWEACCSLSSGSLHQQCHSYHHFGYHWLHRDSFCIAAVFCDSEDFCRITKWKGTHRKIPFNNA